MTKYIDGEKLAQRLEGSPIFDNFGEDGSFIKEFILELIKMQPAADVAPVRHGEWVKNQNGGYVCSECDCWLEDYYGATPEMAKYCFQCGAKWMKKGKTKMELNAEQIIKALKVYEDTISPNRCGVCFFATTMKGVCEPLLFRETLALIKGLTEENERLRGEKKEGKWKQAYNSYPKYVCTNCNHLFNNKSFKYCPNCGAKMDGGASEE